MTASVVPFGDTALLVEVGDVASARGVAAAVGTAVAEGRAPVGVEDVVVGFSSVLVRLGPARVDGATKDHRASGAEWLRQLAGAVPHGATPAGGRTLEVPVRFDGPDLPAVAAGLGLSEADVVGMLTGQDLEVAFLGFAPGFPYLVGLPRPLAGIGRREAPRPSVPSGSVAIAGGFASIYPQSTPGGWMLLGRTSVRLFDPDRPPFARLRPGDRVRFQSAAAEPAELAGPDGPDDTAETGAGARRPIRGTGPRFADVIRPGALTLVQDAGRRGVAAIGVPDAGPADAESMALANRLVGNEDGAAALEITFEGPALRFNAPAHCAVVAGSAAAGSEGAVGMVLDGHPCQAGTIVPVGSGQVLDIGRTGGVVRAYLAVGGGFRTPVVLGSRSSDVLCGLGPGPLAGGDRLDLGPPTRPHGHLLAAVDAPAAPGGPVTLRVMAGPHPLGREAWDSLVTGVWIVDEHSNRVGLRLTGPDPLPTGASPPVTSTGMVSGAVQVPPDGNPIVLMPDHATVGGYPVVGCVVSADLAVLGRLGPGQAVRFVPIGLDDARQLAVRHRHALAARVSGWFPTRTGT